MSTLEPEEWQLILTILGEQIEDLDDEIANYKYKIGKYELSEDTEREYQSNKTLRDALIILANKIRNIPK